MRRLVPVLLAGLLFAGCGSSGGSGLSPQAARARGAASARASLDHQFFSKQSVQSRFRDATRGMSKSECQNAADGAYSVWNADKAAEVEAAGRINKGDGVAVARDFALKNTPLCK